MKVTITYTYKDNTDVFDHVTYIKHRFDYKLGAGVELKIDGKRNKVRIAGHDIRHMTITD